MSQNYDSRRRHSQRERQRDDHYHRREDRRFRQNENNHRQHEVGYRPQRQRSRSQTRNQGGYRSEKSLRAGERPYGRQQPPAYNKGKMFSEIKTIDRRQTCPFLVRCFYAVNDENHYRNEMELPSEEKELHLHLWMNSTLKEISEIMKAMVPSIRSKQRFHFWKLEKSREKDEYTKVELGWIYSSKRYDKVDEKALCHTKFSIGDIIDVSVTYK